MDQPPNSPSSLFPELNATKPFNLTTKRQNNLAQIQDNLAQNEEEPIIPPNFVRRRLSSLSPQPSPSPPRRTQKRKLSQVNNNNNNHNNHNHNFNNNEDKNYDAELNKLQEAEILIITKAYKKQIRTIKNKYSKKKRSYYTNKLNRTMLLSGKFPSK